MSGQPPDNAGTNVLLRGEAVSRTARRATDGATPIRPILEAFIDFQRTDGREALLDVLTAKSGYHGVTLSRGDADRVVTALFGPVTARTRAAPSAEKEPTC